MAGRKVEVLEGELGQLKTDFEEKISDFQNQFSSIHEKMDGRFAALEDLMKKMIDDKQKLASSETIGGHGRGGNPNPSRGRENPEVEVLEGDDGMPPLEPLSREELSWGYDRQEAEYVGRREEFYRRGAGFERIQRRGANFEGGRADFHRRGADFERIQRRGADFEGRREEIHRRAGLIVFHNSLPSHARVAEFPTFMKEDGSNDLIVEAQAAGRAAPGRGAPPPVRR
ncbi:hypothetical protein M5K25_007530 [Dendrobium thyrsiflorum]|uniref:Uncharacterized protein n=1 Tax=Dendrobium thyrsiflorum TaxID=117978 RepID=A0ABD0VLH4_DENTH